MNLSRIKCPYCGEDIAATAKKCRFCGEWLPTTQAEQQPMQQPQTQQTQQTVTQQTQIQQPAQPLYPQTQYQQPQPPVSQEPPSSGAAISLEKVVPNTLSFFEAYFVTPYFRHYADFKGVTNRKSFWLSMLALLIVNIGVIGLGLLLCAAASMLVAALLWGIWSLALVIPGIAIGCRRLRDAGKSPWLYLLGLIPLVGPIILLVFLCRESQYDHSEENAKFKPVDIIITAMSIILLVGGIISLGKGVSDILGGMNEYDAESYMDNGSENGECVIDEAYDDSDTSEILSDDYSESQIIPETDSEYGFSNGMNYLDGNMISKQGKRYPFKLQFYYDASTGKFSNIVYKNVNYGTTILLKDNLPTDGTIEFIGKDGKKNFIINFEGSNPYTGEAWSGDFRQDVELFKQ